MSQMADTLDTLTVKNWFKGGSLDWRVEQTEFADGTLWNADQIIERAPLLGTAYHDTLIALDGHDNVVYGLAGRDKLFGRDGNDTLHGETSRTNSTAAAATTTCWGAPAMTA